MITDMEMWRGDDGVWYVIITDTLHQMWIWSTPDGEEALAYLVGALLEVSQ